MEYKNLIIEKEEAIAVLTMNRPKMLNALNSETLSELKSALESLEKDKEVKAVVITGAERAFVAGADISEMIDMNALEGQNYGKLGQEAFFKIENLRKPVIAAVNGFALGGGCELAMACDIRIASSKAKFGQPEVNLGVTPGFGGTQRLPRLVGKAKAKELIFTGDIINADEALRIGLVNQVVEPEKLMEESKNLAKKIASKGQIAVQLAKADINYGMEVDLASGCTIEVDAFGLCFSTKDQKEGMKAFLEKRKPKFEGK